MSTYTLDDLARLVDHTNLHADATEADMTKLCDEAKTYHFKMVAINQVQSKFCSEQLARHRHTHWRCHRLPPRPDLDRR